MIEAEKVFIRHLELRDFEIVGEREDDGHQLFKIGKVELSYKIKPLTSGICRIELFFRGEKISAYNVYDVACIPAVDKVLFQALRYALK